MHTFSFTDAQLFCLCLLVLFLTCCGYPPQPKTEIGTGNPLKILIKDQELKKVAAINDPTKTYVDLGMQSFDLKNQDLWIEFSLRSIWGTEIGYTTFYVSDFMGQSTSNFIYLTPSTFVGISLLETAITTQQAVIRDELSLLIN